MPSNDKARRHKHAVKLTEINEKLAQIKAVPLHTKESVNTIKHFSIGQLRMLFKRKQSPVPHQYQTAYDKGEFTRFPSDPATTLIIKGDDGGIITCRSSLRDPSILKSIAILFNNLPPYEATPANRSGTSRGRHPYRHYCVWSPYSKRPFLSKEFKRHGLVAQHFMEKGDALWEEMSSLLGRYFKGTYKEFERYPLPDGLQRLAGVWMGAVINTGQEDAPVETEAHQDVQEAKYGFSCLCPFGQYVGGALVLWELRCIVELQPGEMLIFPDAIIHHSNEPVTGIRHSIVAFTQQNMLDFFARKYQLKGLPNKKWRPLNKIAKSRQEVKHTKWVRKEKAKAQGLPLPGEKRKKKLSGEEKQARKLKAKAKAIAKVTSNE
jgi:hypothetical protein